MFSPPPTRLRRHIRPYKLAPIEREMYVQETISDSPFYSTTAYSSDYSSKLPPISSPAPSSIPMLIMTDDGGDDWEVLSEVKTCTFLSKRGRCRCTKKQSTMEIDKLPYMYCKCIDGIKHLSLNSNRIDFHRFQ